ncbi:methyl-accepting chemotaxis protein [Mobilitalea sibirica]|uniref:Methyl-accepting chemotaxis protein n=1 Tax=Mobilitalea sibirica TaxID=1462919 RepID=A0A8J7KTW8_9FIRM|nr:methyl-accepting chemotaxis protein [Mobilitalea sibirica]MBH1941826.1 methyl-accepting chemotaxis protein [Mobilitalea sibirica]
MSIFIIYTGFGLITGERISSLGIIRSLGLTRKKLNGILIVALTTYLSMGVALFLGIVVSFNIIRIYLIKPIKEVEQHVLNLAQGDFSVPVPKMISKKKDEFGVVAKAFIQMQSEVSNIISEVITKSSEVDLGAKNLSKTSKEMSSTSQELANTMEQVAEGATSQVEHLQGILKSLQELEMSIKSANDGLSQVERESDVAESKAIGHEMNSKMK